MAAPLVAVKRSFQASQPGGWVLGGIALGQLTDLRGVTRSDGAGLKSAPTYADDWGLLSEPNEA